ncbi:MAG: hypothetical protein WD226_05205 [Planctomycetota bacterium]
MTHSTDVHARLDRLEREGRRWRRTAMALGAALIGTLALGLATPAPALVEDEVRAARFVLVGEDGESIATLEPGAEGHAQLLMRRGKHQAYLSSYGPSLLLRGGEGRRGAFLGVEPDGTVKLDVKSEALVDGVRIAVKPDGSSGVYALDKSGFERAHMEALADGSSSLGVRSQQGQPRGLMGLDANGVAHMLLMDGRLQRRVGMVQPSDPIEPTQIVVQDAEGRVRSEISTNLDGSPSIKLFSSIGDISYEAP